MDREADGKPLRTPGSIYDAPYVISNSLKKKTVDETNLGWRPKLPIPEPRTYFGNSAGRKMDKSEIEQEPTLGNKWKKR